MEKYLPVLRTCHLFGGLSDADILQSLACIGAEVRRACRGAVVMRAGERTEELGLLLSGVALVTQEDIWGNRNIMTRLSPGETFAETFALLRGEILSVNVTADEECEIMLLRADRLMTSCATPCGHHSQVIRNLTMALARRTLQFNDKIRHMSKRRTRDKLLSYLSAEAIRCGSLSFDIPYDRQELADFLCVDRAAMSAELTKLKEEGVLTTTRSRFELNPALLPGRE